MAKNLHPGFIINDFPSTPMYGQLESYAEES